MKSVNPINWDPNALTITSINFNKGNNYSPWVEKIFGSKAFVSRPEFEKDKFKGFEYFKNNFSIPTRALWSSCSVELLGFGRHDVDEPLTNSIRMSHPATGYGSFSFGIIGDNDQNNQALKSWDCIYRGLHDTWRFQNFHTKPNFWAVLFYCYPLYHDANPLENLRECDAFRDYSSSSSGYTKYEIQMNLRNLNWTHTFYGNVHYSYKLKYGDIKQSQRHKALKNNRKKSPTTAICLVLTYAADTEKLRHMNGAFLVEFLRYYTMLGMKVFIYDRDGSHQEYIYGNNHFYKNMQNITFATTSILYHNFTIRDRLDGDVLRHSDRSIPHYDRIHLDSTDDDKTNTLTHCRMEAKVTYNIDQVLVVDTDELMYCPQGGPSISGQRSHINSMIYRHKVDGFEQLEMEQRMVLPRYEDVEACVQNAVQSGESSILSCFTSYENYVGRNRRKSLHLMFTCPLTDFHVACSPDFGINNCLCQSKFLPTCGLIHLSLNKQKYAKFNIDRSKYSNKMSNLEVQDALRLLN